MSPYPTATTTVTVGDENDHDNEVGLAPTTEPLSGPTPAPNATTHGPDLHQAAADVTRDGIFSNSSSGGALNGGKLSMLAIVSLGAVAIIGAVVGRKMHHNANA